MNCRIFARITAMAIICFGLIIPVAGCKKPEPARVMINVEGQLFSNAVILIDGKPAGKLIQTFLQTDGQLFIDGIYTVTLPPEHHDIPESDKYSGVLDSFRVEPGQHTILFQQDDGTALQVAAELLPGFNVFTYYADEQTLKWNNSKIPAAPGMTVRFAPAK
ncbi:MAG: hypothetical protein ACYDHW_11690 [Syntrophorhabdaceae bacterium]